MVIYLVCKAIFLQISAQKVYKLQSVSAKKLLSFVLDLINCVMFVGERCENVPLGKTVLFKESLYFLKREETEVCG